MKKNFTIVDIKLGGRYHSIIRGFFLGAFLVLAATLLGAIFASRFDATTIKVSLAIMTIPAYAYYFLAGFCHSIEVRPAEQTIYCYPLLKKKPACYSFAAISSITKRTLQKKRFLYQFKVEKAKLTICTDQQGTLEKVFPDLLK